MKMVDLCACDMCHTVAIQPIFDMKQKERAGYCYVCKAQRKFIPVLIKVSPRGQVIIEIP